MIYGYARVSTVHQERDGNSLESQTEKLRSQGCAVIITEAYTGSSTSRPKLCKLLQKLQPGDTLCICSLDRFARTVIEGVQLVKNLLNREINVNILNIGRIENTPTGQLILTVMLAFAEFERSIIAERTQAGKLVAKQSPSYREGRPRKYSREQILHALSLLSTHSYSQVERLTGISKSTLIRAKRNM